MSERQCRGVNRDGTACRAVVVQANGWCSAHDPDKAEQRKRAAARANEKGRDPELQELREGLARLMVTADKPEADRERIDQIVRVARTRAYVIKIDHETQRSAREITELEDAYDRLLSDYEDLRDGRAVERGPTGWYLRRRQEAAEG